MAKPATDNAPVIVWFRDDLRLADNRALTAAVDSGQPVIAVYIHDEASKGLRPLGGAARWWLHHSLTALGASLARRGCTLTLLEGAAESKLADAVKRTGATRVTWSRRYGAAERDVDTRIKSALNVAGVAVESFCDHLLVEPWQLSTQSGTPFRVFTPFHRALLQHGEPTAPLPAPKKIAGTEPAVLKGLDGVALTSLGLLPQISWDPGLRETWTPGEAGAADRLQAFLDQGLDGYADGRDRIDQQHTSRLSPHLRFGEISPRQAWQAVHKADAPAQDRSKYLAELAWREFSHHLLFHNPNLATRNFAERFDAFPWRRDARALKAWQKGQTGVPIVDAGMRELWHTGIMHNRVRMIAASYLVKHLLIDWRQGEAWFWDTLVDADPANNPASWQWVAGSGADAAPYFRVFNPVLQAAKFDPDGGYIRRWVPELAKLPTPHLFKPWEAPKAVLGDARVVVGKTYPQPLVDLDAGRARALAAFAQLPKT